MKRSASPEEIDALLSYFDTKSNMIIPMGRVIRFAVATAMRLEEIFKIDWDAVDFTKRIVVVKDRNDPRRSRSSPAIRPGKCYDVRQFHSQAPAQLYLSTMTEI